MMEYSPERKAEPPYLPGAMVDPHPLRVEVVSIQHPLLQSIAFAELEIAQRI